MIGILQFVHLEGGYIKSEILNWLILDNLTVTVEIKLPIDKKNIEIIKNSSVLIVIFWLTKGLLKILINLFFSCYEITK